MDEQNNFSSPSSEQPFPPEEPSDKKKKKKDRKHKGTAAKVIAIILLCCIVGGLTAIGGERVYKDYIANGYLKGRITGQMPEDISGDVKEIPEVTPSPVPAATPAPEEEKAEEPAKELPSPKPSETPVVVVPPQAADSSVLSAADLYERNVNSTVGILANITGYNYFGQRVSGLASGSGFIISEDGYILTNYHVVDGSTSVSVATYDGKNYDAAVIGYDEDNDIAVLKANANGLVPVVCGDSDSIRVGDTVYAIGNPLGELTFSMTQGIVSGLAREVQVDADLSMTLMQTDCAINSGNSGGALFNDRGEVVGITNAKYSSSANASEASIDNIGFAIPINSVEEIVKNIQEGGYETTTYIGITVTDVTEEITSFTGVDDGAVVASVTDGAPAAQAGLQPNDIILKANGKEINSSSDLVEFVAGLKAGDNLELTVFRQGKEVTIQVTVGERAQSVLNNEPEKEPEQNQEKQSGQQITPEDPFYDYFFGDQGNGAFGYGFPWGWFN